MAGSIPRLVFRVEPGYTFDQDLKAPEIQRDNLLVGVLAPGGEFKAVFLGKSAEYERAKNVWLDTVGAHAIYVMGKRRSGKTYTLGVILEGLASDNWINQGPKEQAVLLLDTMNVFITMPHMVEDVFNELDQPVRDLRQWELPSEKFNIVLFHPRGSPAPPEGKSKEVAIRPSDLSAEDWAGLFGVDTYSDPIGQLIAELHEKVAIEGYTDSLGHLVTPNPCYGIHDFLTCLDNCPEISRFELRTIEAVRRRFKAVERLDIFSEAGTDVRELFVPGQISVLLLRDIEQNLRSLLVGMLVKEIMKLRSRSERYERLARIHLVRSESSKEKDEDKARYSRERYEHYMNEAKKGLPRGWIVIDEAHNYMPARGVSPSSEPLKKYVNEGRNLGLSIVMATQNPSALDPSIRRNADILIVHSISMRDDITAAEGMINTFVPDSFKLGRREISSRVFEQLVRSLPQGYAVISSDNVTRLFVAKIRPRLTVHGGFEY